MVGVGLRLGFGFGFGLGLGCEAVSATQSSLRKMRSESSHMTFSTVLGRFSMAMLSSLSFCHRVLPAWLGSVVRFRSVVRVRVRIKCQG